MAQSINIIHPEETLLNYNETTRYKFNGAEWIRNDDINIDRYTDKSIEDLDINVESMSDSDYIELSKTYHNILIQSEDLENSIWRKKNVMITKSDKYFTFPDNAKKAFGVKTTSNITNTDHSISQQFVAKLDKTYIFSAFVKNFEASPSRKLAISIKDVTYNVIMTADFDPDNSTFVDDVCDLTSRIKLRNGSNYQEISGIEKYFSDYSAKLIRIKQDGQYYYRPFIKFKILNTTHFETIIHMLNPNGEYKYTIDGDSYMLYMSGGQLEEYSVNPPEMPAPYMITYKNTVQHIAAYALYGIYIDHQSVKHLTLLNNKINYLESVKEVTVKIIIDPSTGEERIYKKIQSSKPSITDAKNGDLAIVQSMISFGSIASDINNKKYTAWVSNKSYQLKDRVSYLSNLYECIQAHISGNLFSNDISKWKIILDSVGLGFSPDVFSENKTYNVGDKVLYKSNEYECIISISQGHAFNSSEWKIIIDTTPSECIRYNKDSKIYEIKKSDPEGDRWEVLKSKSSNGIKSMVNALTYNQGIFQTWDQQSLEEPSYEYGFNSGGNYNFVKLKQISDKL